jgi:PKD repeat protein
MKKIYKPLISFFENSASLLNKTFFVFIPLLSLLFFSTTSAQTINFGSTGLVGTAINNPTSLEFGPDGKLYVSQQNGTIWQFTVERDQAAAGSGSYSITESNQINLVKTGIPNHNDDGSNNTSNNRQITGILTAGTASNPILYVSSSDSRIGGGGGAGNDTNLDTNSGVLSRLTWNGSAWNKVDLVRGLPRCEENHATNGLDSFVRNGNTYILIQQGGNTNMGAPSNNFAGSTEFYLAGAMLIINLTQLEQMEAANGGPYTDNRQGNPAYIYDLPTLNDPEKIDITNTHPSFPYNSGHPLFNATIDLGDPFGGNNGLNQSFTEPNGPVQIFSPGYRNAYDVVIAPNGNIYSGDNGPNGGWGGKPNIYTNAGVLKGDQSTTTYNALAGDYITNEFNITNGITHGDALHHVGNINDSNNTYYAGHPVPIRAFPSRAQVIKYEYNGSNWIEVERHNWANLIQGVSSYFNTEFTLANFPDDSRQGEYLADAVTSSKVNIFDVANSSTNGICIYTASNFDNAMKGDILTASFNGAINRYSLNAAGDGILSKNNTFFSGFGSIPLDIIAQGDTDPFPGTIWAATYGADNITIFEPSDFGDCILPDDLTFDPLADYDGDGFTNEDEIANNTNYCSAGSKPTDNDGDFISDLNDLDDDNDGIADIYDAFAIDSNNGTTTTLPIIYPFWNNDPGIGFFGLGFTGLMVDANGTTDYLTQYDSEKLAFGGAGGKASIDNVSSGDALLTANTQQNAFQFGINVDTNSNPFTVHSKVENPFNGQEALNGQSYGIQIGNGDQDNYLKIAISDGSNVNDNTNGFVITLEENGIAVTNIYDVSALLAATGVDLYMNVNPSLNTVQIFYSLNDGQDIIALGNAITLPLSFLDATDVKGLAVGIISTSGNSGSSYIATWDFINVTEDQPSALASNPASLDFGSLLANGSAAQLNLEILNQGGPSTGSIQVSEINISGVDAALFSNNSTLPLIIGAGANKILPISFTTGSAIGNKNASLDLTYDSGNKTLSIPLIGNVTDEPEPLVRINTGNNAIFTATDNGPNWESNPTNGAYVGSSYTVNTGINVNSTFLFENRHSSIPSYIDQATFTAIFNRERYDQPDGDAMEFNVPLLNGAYTVNLYIGNSYGPTNQVGSRIFDILIENNIVFDNLDLITTFGHQVAGMVSFPVVVTDGELNIGFRHEVENPLINAIEIVSRIASGNQAPIAIASASTITGEAPLEVSFIGNTSSDDSGIVSYAWNFGDGSPIVTASNAVHTFSSIGAFNVSLTVMDAENLSNTTIIPINVLETLLPSLTLSVNNLNFGQIAINTFSPLNLDLNHDGNGSENITINSISISGTDAALFSYTASLPLTIASNISSPINITFTANGTIGNKIATLEITHTGLNSPTIIPLSAEGINPSLAIPLARINAGFNTNFSATDSGPNWEAIPSDGVFTGNTFSVNTGFNINSTLLFANRHSSIPTYIDQATFTAIFARERYDAIGGEEMEFKVPLANGNYRVNLYVGNSYSLTSQAGSRIFDILIENNIVFDNLDLISEFGHQVAGMLSFSVAVTDGELNILFGHEVENPILNAIEIVSVNSSENQAPVAIASANLLTGSAPLNVTFSGSASTDDNNDIVSYAWNFGNGDSAMGLNPTYTFTAAGNYTVTLTVTDGDGNTGTDNITVDAISAGSCQWNSLADSSLEKVESQSAKVGDKLYVMAGFLPGLQITGATEIYDANTGIWSTGAPMPTPVTHMGITVVGTDIWIVSGFVGNHPGTATNLVQIYNTVSNTWSSGPNLPAPRGSGAVTFNNGKIHYFGGLLPDRVTDVGEHYVLDVNNQGLGWISAAALPNPRNHLSAASVNGLVYAIGGQFGHDSGVQDQNFLDVYDPATDTWTRLANLPSARSHFEPGTIVHNGKIIIVGGRRANFFFDDITEYNPITNQWSERCKLPEKLLAPVAKVFGDRLIVTNGGVNGASFLTNATRWISIEPELEFPPIVFDPIANQFNAVGQMSNLVPFASGGDPNENITYSLIGQPEGLIIEPTNGQITGIITAGAATGGTLNNGVHSVVVTAEKPGSAAINVNFNWTITATPTSFAWFDKDENENYTPRHECSFVQAGDKFYLFGGRENARTLDIYDYTTNTWNSLVNSAPIEFNHFQAVEYQGLIWVIGAFQTNNFPSEIPANHIWSYNPATNQWLQGPEIPAARKRGSTGLVLYNDKFYIIAGNTIGHNGGYVPWFDEYDPATGTWTVLADAPRARDHFHATVINGKLYAASGRLSGGPGGIFAPTISEVDVYDFSTESWSTLPMTQNLPTPRAAAVVANFENKLIVAGGEVSNSISALSITEIFDPATQLWSNGAALNHQRHGTQGIVSGNGIFIAAGSPLRGGGNQKNMEFYGSDNPSGIASVASILSAPTEISFNDQETKEISLEVAGGNVAVLIKTIEIEGVNAADFILNNEFSMALFKTDSQNTLSVSHIGTGNNNAQANLLITYNNLETISIDLMLNTPSINEAPVAVLAANILSGEVPLEVSFNGDGSTDDSGIASYAWDFGDGTTSTLANPVHTFTTEGVFEVTLTVTDADSLSNSASLDIEALESTVLNAQISGELKQYHKVTITYDGVSTNEIATTFKDYRLDVTFTSPTGKSYKVPGYFAADGNAAESSSVEGNKWRCHFTPLEQGNWTYLTSYRNGTNIAVSFDPNEGTSVTGIDGQTGTFNISNTDKSGLDFRAKGKLEYVGEHFLRWTNGEYFLKIGNDSPDNFLEYNEFDNTTYNRRGERFYPDHIEDWNNGNPLWKNGLGKGLIGAVNYLSQQGINSQYVITDNTYGDTDAVFPWINKNDHFVYDTSKLDQWQIIFDHMIERGMMVHFVLSEAEQQSLFELAADAQGDPNFADARKIYFRELVARFGYLNAITWNIGEESGWNRTNTYGRGLTTQQQIDFANYLDQLIYYKDNIVLHNGPAGTDTVYTNLIGNNAYTGNSMQGFLSNTDRSRTSTKKWRSESALAGKKWVVSYDEAYSNGTLNGPQVRSNLIWSSFTAGAAGVELYFPGRDLVEQNFKTYQPYWEYMRYAREFFMNNNIPFYEMENKDEIVSQGWCFAKELETYVIYLQNGGSTSINLEGEYTVKWFDPRNGGTLLDGSIATISGGNSVSLGLPPNNQNSDWVILLTSTTNQAPIANAIADITTGEAPLEVNFSGSSSTDDVGIVSYAWNFGDGNSSTLVNPTHTFTTLGTFNVVLTVTDVQNLSDTASITIETADPAVNQAPVAIASADVVSGVAPLVVNFNGSSSTDDVGVVSYAWDFGDGNSSTQANPTHTFTTQNVFNVSLTVTDVENLTSTTSISIDATQVANAEGVVSLTLINSTTDIDILNLVNGIQINQNTIQATLFNIRANTNPSIVGSVALQLSGPVNRTQNENVAPYALFGDTNGNYAGQALPLGNYTATATAYSGASLGGTLVGSPLVIQFSIVEASTANQAPIAVAFSNVSSGGVPLEVNFTGSSSTDDMGIVGYLWNFGDGATSPLVNPTHTFTTQGTFNVTLTVTDAGGLTNTASIPIETINAGINQAPNAVATANISSGTLPLAVNFNGSSSTDDLGIVSYAWDFGDGNSSTLVNPAHTFTTLGTFNVVLTVTDVQNLSDTASITIETADPAVNQAPVAIASADVVSGVAPLVVNFNGSSSTDDVGVVSYAWDFGDGNSSTQANPTHTFTTQNVFNVSLTVTDVENLTSTTSISIDATQVANAEGVVSLTLINSTTDIDILNLVNGIQINQNTIQATLFNIRANTNPSIVGSVFFSLTGPVVRNINENIAPYAIFGDTNGNYSGQALPLGNYTLTATAYSGASQTGVVLGNPLVVQFTMINTTNQAPVAVASANITSGDIPLTVAFNGSNSTDDLAIVSYAWNFGDGNTAAIANPAHTFTTQGTFNVTLTVTDAGNLSNTTSISINTISNGIFINDVTLNEGENAILTVSLLNDILGGFSVDFNTQDNTALNGNDYLTNSGTLTFAGFAGEIQTISIPTIDDETEENIETFFVNLSNATNGIAIIDNQAIVSINANDSGCNSDYNEQNGTVIIEAENLNLPNGWVIGSSATGFTGSGYISYNNGASFNNPGRSTIATTIKINTPGIYLVQWRSKIGQGDSNTDDNDTWLRFNDASEFYAVRNGAIIYPKGSGQTPVVNGSGSNNWFKVYTNSIPWSWQTRTNDNLPYEIYVRFDNPGVYTMEISARSENHFIDRIVLTTNPNGETNLGLSETLCNITNNLNLAAKGQVPETTRVSIYPNSATTEINIYTETTIPDNVVNTISMFDMSGRLVKSGNSEAFSTSVHEFQLPITGIEDGVYILRIVMKDGTAQLKKVIVKN